MTTDDCVFCKIIRKELSVPIRYETNDVLVFDDRFPKAPVHLLIIPKRHIEWANVGDAGNAQAIGALLPTAATVGRELKLNGFKLHANNGTAYGQSVSHLHLHLLSGQFSKDALQSL